MARQLIFDLPVRPARGREDFFVAPANERAVAQIDAWRDWPSGKLLLIGAVGAGKTHLSHVWAEMTGAPLVQAGDPALSDPPALLDKGGTIVENVDRIAGDREAETALFHVHNLAGAQRVPLLLTARTPPRDWPPILPDLASRLTATATARLDPPDDALLAAILVKLFNDRQLAVTPHLIRYLVPRMERSFAAAARIVTAIDREALSTGRKPGVKLAGEVLDKVGPPTR
ncbi:Chromosomal replication initiator protein DnaA [Rhodovulum sp. P5]|uniref:DnaA ATPase domain-containing protein n=1 Tax=Rhodovulum sp. P5 TaxID=1564506 RepID=UPI0009C23A59|nr:DnaA/Hda family protein [Rhodovulum sp. P5]ARE39875.1 Chromosomal replication initiator protein DnaA [Rhodovulum sp. P5]